MKVSRAIKGLLIGAGSLLLIFGVFSARGNYGQYIYVAPEKDLVIVRLGKVEGEKGYGYWIGLFDELSTKLDVSAKGSS